MTSIKVLAATLSVIVTVSACGTYTPPDQAAAAAANGSDGEVTCRSIMVQGSNMARRYCATADQWAEYDGDARAETVDALRRMNSRAISPPSNAPAAVGP